MGFDVASIFEGGISGIFKGVREVVGAFKVDPTIAANHAAKLAEMEYALNTAQLQAEIALAQAQNKVNEIEAASSDKYASRWRPSAGWLGVVGLAYSVIVYPLLTWASLNFGWKTPPPLDTSVLVTLLMGMLGLGTMRTYERTQGTNGKALSPR